MVVQFPTMSSKQFQRVMVDFEMIENVPDEIYRFVALKERKQEYVAS